MLSQASCLIAEWEQLENRMYIYTSTPFCLQWNEGWIPSLDHPLLIAWLTQAPIHQNSVSQTQLIPNAVELDILLFIFFGLDCGELVLPLLGPTYTRGLNIEMFHLGYNCCQYGSSFYSCTRKYHPHGVWLVDLWCLNALVFFLVTSSCLLPLI